MNCKICSSKTVRIENNKNNKVYYNCINCDYIFINGKLINSSDKEKLRYLKHNNSFEDINYVEMLRSFIKEYIKFDQDKINKILDFGCGPIPVLAKLLEDKGFNVDVYDKYFFPHNDYLKKKYDLITLIEVIEHLKNPIKELTQLKKHLNKNGFFIIKTLFHPGNNDIFLKWWYKEDFTHISFFSQKTFKIISELLNMKLLTINNKDLCILQKI